MPTTEQIDAPNSGPATSVGLLERLTAGSLITVVHEAGLAWRASSDMNDKIGNDAGVNAVLLVLEDSNKPTEGIQMVKVRDAWRSNRVGWLPVAAEGAPALIRMLTAEETRNQPPPSAASVRGDTKEDTPARSIISKSGAPPALKEMLKQKNKQNEKDAALFSPATKQNDDDDDDDSVLDADVLGLLRSLDDIPADKKRRITITNNNNNGNDALEETPRCQGYMYKQGHHWHSWKRRWFVLRLSCLNYYRRRQNQGGGSQIPQGTIPLNKITALQRDVGKFPQPFCFQLVITGEGRNNGGQQLWLCCLGRTVVFVSLPFPGCL
jgi:hypothetical protein